MPVRRNKRRLEEQPWFWGLISATEAEKIIKKKGNYLVRGTVVNSAMSLILSVGVSFKSDDFQVEHFSIKFEGENRKWHLEGREERFEAVLELVSHYRAKPLNGNTVLSEHMTKPSWFLNNHVIMTDDKKHLGGGNFSVVVRGRFKNHDVAVKKLLASEEALKEKEALLKEARMMSLLRSPYIIEFYGIALDTMPPLLVMELMGGELLKHLVQHGQKICDGEKLLYCWQLAKGLAHMAEKKIVHRDLAARNCLFSKYGILKVTDFGLSDLTVKLAAYCTATEQMPVRWMAPETMLETAVFSEKSDVWSFGVLSNEIFSNGKKPLSEFENVKAVMDVLKSCKVSPHVPEKTAPAEVATMMEKCWLREPNERPDFNDLVMLCSSLFQKFPPPPIEQMSTQLNKNMTPLTIVEYEILRENHLDSDDSDSDSSLNAEVGQMDKTRQEEKPRRKMKLPKSSN
ncbi:unnamed protein product [Caenorhabditis auriculariae]|uniref:Tyrosine-protein kinase n=1 Tax=Caenorhabditis auriculariae TaxID=2777116 RepID=A0A8S1GWY8_9PELO|nr:unnamed protein product [Caenorhabditis auriculariae]